MFSVESGPIGRRHHQRRKPTDVNDAEMMFPLIVVVLVRFAVGGFVYRVC